MSNDKIVFLDCDETLWTSPNKDRIWSVPGSFEVIDNNAIVRSDSAVFTLKKDVRQALGVLRDRWFCLWIISDNIAQQVAEVLNLFHLSDFFDQRFISVELRESEKQRCPKEQMIKKLLEKHEWNSFKEVYLVDDKDYRQAMLDNGYKFIHSQYPSLLSDIEELVK